MQLAPLTPRSWQRVLLFVVVALLGLSPLLAPAPRAEAQTDWQVIPGHVPPIVKRGQAARANAARPDEIVDLSLGLAIPRQAELTAFLQRQRDPASSDYGRTLTPEQFADRFGITAAQQGEVIRYLQSRGLSVDSTSRNRLLLGVSGRASQVEAAFSVRLSEFSAGGRTFRASQNEPAVPGRLRPLITAVNGLETYTRERHSAVRILDHAADGDWGLGAGGWSAGSDEPAPLAASLSPTPNTQHPTPAAPAAKTPAQLAAAYNFNDAYRAGWQGEGQTIAIATAYTFNVDDLRMLQLRFGLPTNQIEFITIGRTGVITRTELETALDVTVVSSLAPAAKVLVYQSEDPRSSTFLQMYNRIASDDLAAIVSTSWGLCEALRPDANMTTLNNVFQGYTAQGISMTAASGDDGSTDCGSDNPVQSVDYPASDPNVLAVGGTSLYEDYELGWAGSGGGTSGKFSQPAWQTGPGVPSSGYRNVPDVSAAADPATGYTVRFNGSYYSVGGTSAASPLWASALTLATQAKGSRYTGLPGRLYQVAAAGASPVPFKDIISGSNGDFSARPGWDYVTGHGTPNVHAIVRGLDTPAHSQAAQNGYVFSWYDALGSDGADWIVVANPAAGGVPAPVTITIGGAAVFNGTVPSGGRITPTFPGLRDGPVVVTTSADQGLVVSQRVRWQGSFEEVNAFPLAQASARYYYADVDGTAGGDWILVSNPVAGVPITVQVLAAGRVIATRPLAPGARDYVFFDTPIAGPIEVRAAETGNPSSAKPFFTSRRTLRGNDLAETVGTPAERVAGSYYFTWYDSVGATANDLLLGNPNAGPVEVSVTLAGKSLLRTTIEANATLRQSFSNQIGGPLVVQASQPGAPGTAMNVLATQRSRWGQSYEDVVGLPANALGAEYWYSWYDSVTTAGSDWILVGNPGTSTVGYAIAIAGSTVRTGTLKAGEVVTPSLLNTQNGPVQVRAYNLDNPAVPMPIFTSQRVILNGDFNELIGQRLGS